METAEKTLITAGTFALLYGLLLGIPMAQARMKGPTAPHHLTNTHLEGLISGAVLLGLSLAASLSTLANGLEVLAASLFTSGVALSLAGGTINWQLGTGDQFAARSPGFLLQAVSGPLLLAGGVIFAIGVLKGL